MKKLLPLLIISLCMVAGCGQKGPLVPPPAAATSQ
ncbi:MAG: hypothetical protein EBS81_03485 [Gammaproteobacteria bacterium]|nr:hypothetical protein [Gammaproteobacteria bacterium]